MTPPPPHVYLGGVARPQPQRAPSSLNPQPSRSDWTQSRDPQGPRPVEQPSTFERPKLHTPKPCEEGNSDRGRPRSASQRSGKNLKDFQDFNLKAKAKIWP